MSLTPGTRLGPYEIVAPLGRGGMGEVFRAIDTRLGRTVAIKIVTESLATDARYRERLESEAKTISRLQHANVCTLYDIGREGGLQYLVMEFLEGQTLAERLRSGPLPVERAVEIGAAIADAVAAAHERNIVHRDLKPGNVMLGPAGTKVLDFGLAKVVDPVAADAPTLTYSQLEASLTRDGAIVGTMPYMAPEQLEGKPPDQRSDIWALGCVLYEMTAGRPPFRGTSYAALISSIMSASPEPIAVSRDPITPHLARIVERCLRKEPSARWQSASELAAELRRTPGTGARDEPAPAPTPPTRRPRIAAVAGVAAIGLALAALWIHQSDAPPTVAVDGAAVAVAPFANLTGNDQLDYIGSGLAAGLTSQLSAIPALNVVGRSRTWDAHGRATGPVELAELLGVNFIVDGEVQAAGDGLQVDLAILDGRSARVLWSDSVTGERDALYTLQQALARSIIRVLSVPLSREDRARLTRAGPSSRAFGYYLQGIERLEQRSNPRHLELAADLFRQAIRIEPEVAVFHASLAIALARRHTEGLAENRPGDAAETAQAEAAARTALRLDPGLPDAHVALARALRAQGRHAESVAELRPVLAQYSKPDEAFLDLAFGYGLTGDGQAALQALESAVALGPENWFNWNALGVAQAIDGDVDAAMESLAKAVQLAPGSVTWPRLNLGGVKLMVGDYAGAIEDFESTGATTTSADLASNMATAYYFLGRLDRAEAMYRMAVTLDPGSHVFRRNLGDALLALERRPEALEQYAKALQQVEAGLITRPNFTEYLRARPLYAAKLDDCAAAVRYANSVRSLIEGSWEGQLDLAMTFALCGRTDEALTAVRACVAHGLPGSMIREQPELSSLATNAEFVAVTAEADD